MAKRDVNEPVVLEGAAAGRAAGILIARGKADASSVTNKLRTRARILRDIAPAVGVSGPGLPAARGKNLEWAADELDAAAEIIDWLALAAPEDGSRG